MGIEKTLPTIGILGGMGPLATADFFYKLIRVMKGERDRDYNRIIMDSNSQIPDRIAALFENGTDPVPELKRSIEMLIDDGVNMIAVPCHTVYPFLKKITNEYPIPILNMVESMVQRISESKVYKVGILASQGTHRLGIYPNMLTEIEVETFVLSDEDNRELVDEARLRVKRGDLAADTENLLIEAVNRVKRLGAEIAALCCSDLPIALTKDRPDIMDSNLIFAETVYRYAREMAGL